MNKLRCTSPAKDWLEGLPVGNGRLAAMVWGDAGRDILDLNHEWLWRGVNRDRAAAPASEHLAAVRGYLQKGDYARATLAANLFFAGNGGLLPGGRVDSYQTAGRLTFTIAEAERFLWRELDIENAVLTAARKTPSAEVRTECFVDCCDGGGLIWSRWYSNGRFSGALAQSRAEDEHAAHRVFVSQDTLRFDCSFEGGLSHRVVTRVQTDGACTARGEELDIENASYILCATNIATSAFDLESELKRYGVLFQAYERIRARHADKFAKRMRAVRFSLGPGPDNNELTALYFHFGRYLMLASSVCGELPANLQGKWNDQTAPPWDCDYHFDINLQMNYWMAEPCGMPECAEALLRYLERFYESGREAAQKLYGCRGVLLPLMSDAWAKSTPESFGWSVWIGAAPWFCRHFWDRYAYSGDKAYLRDRGYRFIRAVAEFYEDYLVEDGNGVFQIMPSQSPENTFREAGGLLPVGIGVSAAMDVQLAYDALGLAVKCAETLETDPEKIEKWSAMRDKLPEFKIGADGRLLEWDRELTETEPGHRHLSHLYGVFPSELFTAETRAAQYEAAQKSLARRLSGGGGHTGWSRAWAACLQARFGDSEGFYEHLSALIREYTTVTLLDLHPPGIFQIDGNLGAVMAVVEAVISCTGGKVHLLRALPKEWPSGELSGVKVPGGHTISLRWRDGVVTWLDVALGWRDSVTVRFPDGSERHFAREA